MACHPPTTLRLLGPDTMTAERQVLSAFRYQPNSVTLHTDESVMPRAALAWSAWNHRLDATSDARANGQTQLNASTHYWMNRLQGVSKSVNYFVSVNGGPLVDRGKVVRNIQCEHPLFDLASRDAQAWVPALNASAVHGTETYFAGAWQRYGFHEDGLTSAIHVAEILLRRDPWPVT